MRIWYCVEDQLISEAVCGCWSQFADPTWSVLCLEYSRSHVPRARIVLVRCYEIVVKIVNAPDDFGWTISRLFANEELLVCYDLVTFYSWILMCNGLVCIVVESSCFLTNWPFLVGWNVECWVEVNDFTYACTGWFLDLKLTLFLALSIWMWHLKANFFLMKNFTCSWKYSHLS